MRIICPQVESAAPHQGDQASWAMSSRDSRSYRLRDFREDGNGATESLGMIRRCYDNQERVVSDVGTRNEQRWCRSVPSYWRGGVEKQGCELFARSRSSAANRRSPAGELLLISARTNSILAAAAPSRDANLAFAWLQWPESGVQLGRIQPEHLRDWRRPGRRRSGLRRGRVH
jgi:hypothetical protein